MRVVVCVLLFFVALLIHAEEVPVNGVCPVVAPPTCGRDVGDKCDLFGIKGRCESTSLYCDTGAGKCKKLKALGESCAQNYECGLSYERKCEDNVCALILQRSGDPCNVGTDCESGSCKNKRCAGKDEGDKCSYGECKYGLYCNNNLLKCKPFEAIGGNCSYEGSLACGYYYESYRCAPQADVTYYGCREPYTGPAGAQCKYPEECPEEYSCSGGKCVKAIPWSRKKCSSDKECSKTEYCGCEDGSSIAICKGTQVFPVGTKDKLQAIVQCRSTIKECTNDILAPGCTCPLDVKCANYKGATSDNCNDRVRDIIDKCNSENPSPPTPTPTKGPTNTVPPTTTSSSDGTTSTATSSDSSTSPSTEPGTSEETNTTSASPSTQGSDPLATSVASLSSTNLLLASACLSLIAFILA